MDYETILYVREDQVATISLNRPERLNTIVPPMPDEVQDAVGVDAVLRSVDRPIRRQLEDHRRPESGHAVASL